MGQNIGKDGAKNCYGTYLLRFFRVFLLLVLCGWNAEFFLKTPGEVFRGGEAGGVCYFGNCHVPVGKHHAGVFQLDVPDEVRRGQSRHGFHFAVECRFGYIRVACQ